jgi:hypothetical protein
MRMDVTKQGSEANAAASGDGAGADNQQNGEWRGRQQPVAGGVAGCWCSSVGPTVRADGHLLLAFKLQ